MRGEERTLLAWETLLPPLGMESAAGVLAAVPGVGWAGVFITGIGAAAGLFGAKFCGAEFGGEEPSAEWETAPGVHLEVSTNLALLRLNNQVARKARAW